VPSPPARSGCKYLAGAGLAAPRFLGSSVPEHPLAARGWGVQDPRELTGLSASVPSTYAPVKPFLRVDKEKVRVGSAS